MLGKLRFLVVGIGLLIWTAAVVVTSAAEEFRSARLFDTRPGHAWDQAREIFYTHRFSESEVFEHPHSFAPPWNEYVPFVHDEAFYEQVLARLEAVEKLPAAQMEEQPALRRVVLLRDLWPAFDGLHQAHVKVPGSDEATAQAVARRDELLARVARIMRRLELTEEEVRGLPSAFQVAREKQPFPNAFDAAAPDKIFFPADLLDVSGDWVTYSREPAPSVGGTSHNEFVKHRSVFTLHLRAPEGRMQGIKFLEDYTKATGNLSIPHGSTLALLRRALVPTRSGSLLVSPLVESLQMFVVTPPRDQRLKFVLDRAELLAGGFGLTPIGKDDPADTSGFESIVLPHRMALAPSETHPPGESLIALRFKTLREVPPALNTCVHCHGETVTGRRLFVFGPDPPTGAFLQPAPDQSAAVVTQQKIAREEWKLYLRLRGGG